MTLILQKYITNPDDQDAKEALETYANKLYLTSHQQLVREVTRAAQKSSQPEQPEMIDTTLVNKKIIKNIILAFGDTLYIDDMQKRQTVLVKIRTRVQAIQEESLESKDEKHSRQLLCMCEVLIKLHTIISEAHRFHQLFPAHRRVDNVLRTAENYIKNKGFRACNDFKLTVGTLRENLNRYTEDLYYNILNTNKFYDLGDQKDGFSDRKDPPKKDDAIAAVKTQGVKVATGAMQTLAGKKQSYSTSRDGFLFQLLGNIFLALAAFFTVGKAVSLRREHMMRIQGVSQFWIGGRTCRDHLQEDLNAGYNDFERAIGQLAF